MRATIISSFPIKNIQLAQLTEKGEEKNNTKNTDICDYYPLNRKINLQISSRKQNTNKTASPNFYDLFIIYLFHFR